MQEQQQELPHVEYCVHCGWIRPCHERIEFTHERQRREKKHGYYCSLEECPGFSLFLTRIPILRLV
jgi:hypothetical protein